MITLLARPMQTLRRYLLDRIVLRPTRDVVAHGDQQRVVMSVLGRRLECFVSRNFDDDGPAELMVLKFPGTAGRAERASSFPLPMLSGVRGEVWTWNPPGYGRSQGHASLKGISRASVDLARSVLARDGVDPKSLWLCGNSLGCNAALHVAASDGVFDGVFDGPIGLILRNPPPLVPVVKRIARRYPMGRFVGPIAESVCDEMNAMLAAPKVKHPAVFLQSQLDDVVPPSMQNDLIAQYRGDKRIVELHGIDHGGVATDRQAVMIAEQIDWLWQQTRVGVGAWKTN